MQRRRFPLSLLLVVVVICVLVRIQNTPFLAIKVKFQLVEKFERKKNTVDKRGALLYFPGYYIDQENPDFH